MFAIKNFLNRKFHTSLFIGWFSATLVLGIACAALWDVSFAHLSWLICGLIFLVFCFIKRTGACFVLIVVSGFLIGLWRGDTEQNLLQTYSMYVGSVVTVKGKVAEDPVAGKRGDMRIQLTDITIDHRKMVGVVWLSVATKEKIKRSDTISVTGELKPGFGSFAASMGFARLTSHQAGIDQARDVRGWFSDAIRRAVPEPQASLGIGYLVGQRSSLPTELDNQLQAVGLTHIVVASGYNLTILVRLGRRFFEKISKYLVALSSGVLITSFMFVTGLSPSMSRAGLVAGLSLAAWYYGRNISPFILLPFVAAISVLVNPFYMWGDVGWYLSFAAFGGVMMLAPLLQNYFFGKKKPGLLRQVLGETLSALLVTAPIVVIVFEQYSSYALLANLLVVPLIPITMLLVFVAGVGGIVVPGFASIMGFPALTLLTCMTTLVGWVAELPNALIDLKVPIIGVAIFYITLFMGAFYMWYKTKHRFQEDNLIE